MAEQRTPTKADKDREQELRLRCVELVLKYQGEMHKHDELRGKSLLEQAKHIKDMVLA